jgi:hypothetical protein
MLSNVTASYVQATSIYVAVIPTAIYNADIPQQEMQICPNKQCRYAPTSNADMPQQAMQISLNKKCRYAPTSDADMPDRKSVV